MEMTAVVAHQNNVYHKIRAQQQRQFIVNIMKNDSNAVTAPQFSFEKHFDGLLDFGVHCHTNNNFEAVVNYKQSIQNCRMKQFSKETNPFLPQSIGSTYESSLIISSFDALPVRENFLKLVLSTFFKN
jgi:hypothetical protein